MEARQGLGTWGGRALRNWPGGDRHGSRRPRIRVQMRKGRCLGERNHWAGEQSSGRSEATRRSEGSERRIGSEPLQTSRTTQLTSWISHGALFGVVEMASSEAVPRVLSLSLSRMTCARSNKDMELLRLRLLSLGLQPCPQKVVRPPKPTPTIFSGGGWSPRDYTHSSDSLLKSMPFSTQPRPNSVQFCPRGCVSSCLVGSGSASWRDAARC